MASLRLFSRRLLPRAPFSLQALIRSHSPLRPVPLSTPRLFSTFPLFRSISDNLDGLRNNRDLQQPDAQIKGSPTPSGPTISASDLELLSKLPPAAEYRGEVPSYAMVVTCKQCDTRSAHKISKQGYHHGTVLLTCPGCKNRHLMADHLKIFSDTRVTLEDILKEKGHSLKKLTVGTEGDVELVDGDQKP